MAESLKIAVIINEPDRHAYRLACLVAEDMWDAGAEVRVRRAAAPTEKSDGPDWSSVLDELEDVPVAGVEDVGWADVVFFPGGTLARVEASR